MALEIGTLVVNVTANTSGLKSELEKVNKEAERSRKVLEQQFNAAGGALGHLGERFGQVGSAVNKMFGKEATQGMRAFGDSIGLTVNSTKGLKAAMEGAEGALKLAGIALQPLTLGLAGAALGAGALRLAWIELTKDGATGAKQQRSWMQDWIGLWLTALDETLKNVSLWADSVLTIMARVGTAMMATPGLKSLGVSLSSGVLAASNMKTSLVDDTQSTIGAMRSQNDQGNLLPMIGRSMGRDFGALGGAAFDGVKASAASFAEMLKGMFGDLSGLIKPSQEKAKNYLGLYLDSIAWILERQKEKEEAAAKMREGLLKSSEELWQHVADQEKATAERAADLNEMLASNYERIQSEQASRWSAVGTGRFGDALSPTGKSTGIGGNAMNIVGGAAASQAPLLGSALGGAAEGASNGGGVWGAVIGAILALLTKTETFSKMLGSIEKLLSGILPILDALLGPLADGLASVMEAVGPILKIIGDLVKSGQVFFKSFDATSRMLQPLLRLIGDLLKMLGTISDQAGNLGGLLDEKIGGEGGTSINDVIAWTTGENIIGGLANELEGKDFVTGKYKNEREVEANAVKTMNDSANAAVQAMADAIAKAKQDEIDAANRAAAALNELADSVSNSVSGYKLAAVMYAAGDRVGGAPTSGNPYGGG